MDNKKPKILQQFFDKQINNGGPATGAILLLNSNLKEKYNFITMDKTYPFQGISLKLFFYFYRTIKYHKPDIVHIRGVQSVGFFGVLAAKLLRCKVVMSIHGMSIDSSSTHGVKRLLYKFIFERFALVYCVCEYACKRPYIQNNAKYLYGYIHNAAPKFENIINNKNIKSYRDKYGIIEDDIVVTIISRVTQEKGLGVLIKSIPTILETNNKVKFIIAGEGDYLPIVEKNLDIYIKTNRVQLLGKISNVNEVLLASDIFVFPTFRENLSNSLLEASVTGLPIITTNVGGNPEIIINKKTGIIIEPNNTEQLIRAVLTLAGNRDLRMKYGKNALKYMEDHFSQNYVFEQMSNMYDSLLQK